MKSKIRLLISALVALIFYFFWSYWANSLVTDDQALIFRSAIVQGVFSATVTLGFTLVLEAAVKRFGGNCLSLVFVVPILCSVQAKTTQNIAILKTFNAALDLSAKYISGKYIAGTLIAPLLPLLMQATLVIAVNLINHTPNLLLTVAPSIFFSGVYGYLYTFTLLTDRQAKTSVKP